MRIVLRMRGGERIEGLLLATGREQMRVVVAGRSDAVEFAREDGTWRAESGDTVEIEALTAIEGLDSEAILAGFAPKAMRAGQGAA